MSAMKSNIATKISDFFVNYFSLNGQLVSQEQAEQNIREGVSFRGTNILILILPSLSHRSVSTPILPP